jgi:hypothetical protein
MAAPQRGQCQREEVSEEANRDKDIRPVMEGMADACRGTKATIVGLIHHNKRSDVDALQKILGASSVAGVARAAWGLGRDPEDKDQRFTVAEAGVRSLRAGGQAEQR